MKRAIIARWILSMLAVFFMSLVVTCFTALADENVNWNSNTQNTELKAPEGISSGTGDWGSQTFISTENSTNTNTNSTSQSNATDLAILAAIAGVLGIAAVTGVALSKKDVTSIIPEGNGIWVPETDREKIHYNSAVSTQH